MKFPQKKGFTLIEVLVVVAIIGILSSVVYSGLADSKKKANDGKRVSNLAEIRLALELYQDANGGRYPTSIYGGALDSYLPTVPRDPFDTNYVYAALGVGLNCYGYHLGAYLETSGDVALKNDDDRAASGVCTGSAADFDGNATNCAGNVAVVPDRCYDLYR